MDDKIQPKKTATAFTCVSCQVQFSSAGDQRIHHQSDWHRYNLKRKIVNLAPVTALEFARRIDALSKGSASADTSGAVAEGSENGDVNNWSCEACDKVFGGKATLDNHCQSKKHKSRVIEFEKEKANPVVDDAEDEKEWEWTEEEGISLEMIEKLKADSKLARDIQKKLQLATTESEIVAILKEKVDKAIKFDPNSNCIFCPVVSECLNDNLEHMTAKHGFFIPDIEFLVDVEGLFRYLGEKISVKNVCLYCNGRGRSFASVEAVWRHMIDRGHTKVAFEEESDELELAEFYDFSSTWMDATDENAQEELTMATTNASKVEYVEGDLELKLPSGSRIGHRSMQRYYKQQFRLTDDGQEQGDDALTLARTAAQYRQVIRADLQASNNPYNNPAIKTAMRKQHARQSRLGIIVSMNANSQKHFRAQMDY
eukprot:Partr_v1_DN25149_c0_g1_i1_m76583 putative Zinc finger protein